MKTSTIAVGALTGALALSTLGLAGCSKPPIEGVVTNKSYTAPYTYDTHPCTLWISVPHTRIVTTSRKVGNSYVTSSSTQTYYTQMCAAYTTHHNYMPATWRMCVEGLDEDGHKARDCFYVDEQEYGRYSQGSHWVKAGT